MGLFDLTPERVRSWLNGKSEAEVRRLLRIVFGELDDRELGIAAAELLDAKSKRGKPNGANR